MNIDNLKSQMRKGMLEFCVLLLLRRGDAYASEIITKMKEAHLIVMEGTLYPPPHAPQKRRPPRLSLGRVAIQGPCANTTASLLSGLQFLEQLKQSWDEISLTVNLLGSSDAAAQNTPQQ